MLLEASNPAHVRAKIRVNGELIAHVVSFGTETKVARIAKIVGDLDGHPIEVISSPVEVVLECAFVQQDGAVIP